jgi:hypothetical protein
MTTLLAARAFAHEIGLTGNRERERIFQKAFPNSVAAGEELFESGNPQIQAAYQSCAFHFVPYALRVVQ